MPSSVYDGKRHQMFRRGFQTEAIAIKEERRALEQFGRTDLAADGTMAAELRNWLAERELDLAVTTLGNCRAIAIGDVLVGILRQHLTQQERERTEAGIVYHRGDYVFCKEDGTPYHPKCFTDRFRALCVESKVPVIVLHDGRASNATVGADHGVPHHIMQKRLGHAQHRTTNDFCVDVLPEAEHRAAQIMEQTILPRPRGHHMDPAPF
ncbi:tyrosine-type recombinase/integrase [Micromonospora sp. NPDC050276]|uniref:tyrosine-type recombinase/integrase n=1 Tax=Micromonospora sp. NPDC050276 TaxID=3364278 RepID=UPI0037B977A0